MDAIDSHTGGEPTRVVFAGHPDLEGDSMAALLNNFRQYHDKLRVTIVGEPRGSNELVGAVLCKPFDTTCETGVIFFNNVGYLGMCGHGTIGLITSLAHLGRLTPGEHRIETPVGLVTTWLHETGEVTVRNVPSFRHRANVAIDVKDVGTVRGDIAWGGNWFFLVEDHGLTLDLANIDALTQYAIRIRDALHDQGISGTDGALIDHIELFGPASVSTLQSRNFVLCPGGAYDRSPCGTGTSAKLACLYADGKLACGEVWQQESIMGSVFEGRIEVQDNQVYPLIKGRAHITAEVKLIMDHNDPLAQGFRT
jgi:4-hydroxyproline epimerase